MRHVAAVERAAAVLDALADGRRSWARTSSRGEPASTPARCPGCSRRSRTPASSSTCRRAAATGSACACSSSATPCWRGSTCARSRDRTCARSPRRPARPSRSRRPATRTPSPSTSSRAARPCRASRGSGGPSVAHATAAGKVALAFGDVALPTGTPRTRSRRGRSSTGRRSPREVERVRSAGLGQAVGEREDDLNAVAAPVHGSRGELAAILGVQGPASRFGEEAMARALEPLLARAAAVSDALGWRPTAKEGS